MVLPNYISTRIYNMPLKKRKNEFMKIFENHENDELSDYREKIYHKMTQL